MRAHDPYFDPPPRLSVPGPDLGDIAERSMWWGWFAVFTFWIPPVGLLAALAGIVLGMQGWPSSNRLQAGQGIAFSIASILLQLALAALLFHFLNSLRF